MEHIKSNLVLVSIFVLVIVSLRLTGVSGKYLAAEICTQFARSILFTLTLILSVICGTGINSAIAVGAISAQMAMIFSADLRLEGAVTLMFVTGASIVLSILFGMMMAALLNRARGRETIVPTMIGQLSSVIYQFVFVVAYELLIQPRSRGTLLNRGIGVGSMMDARNISSAFKGILPFQFDGKTYSFLPPVIILFLSPVLFYIQKMRLGTLTRVVGTDGGTAGTLGIAGSRVRSTCTVISTIFAAMNQILFVAGFGTINVYTDHPGLDISMTVVILVDGAFIEKVRMRNCFVDVILSHALFITSPMVGQDLLHNPSVGECFRSFLAYGVIITTIIMNLRNERTKVQSIRCGVGTICLHT